VRGLLSDNGSEFEGEFDELLKEREIRHYWTYPKSPKMNAHNEQFNRTLQEQFVDYQEDLLFTDLEEFNRRLAGWLMDYNTVLPHHSLGLKPPVRWLLENHPECQRLWTNTVPLTNGKDYGIMQVLCLSGPRPTKTKTAPGGPTFTSSKT